MKKTLYTKFMNDVKKGDVVFIKTTKDETPVFGRVDAISVAKIKLRDSTGIRTYYFGDITDWGYPL